MFRSDWALLAVATVLILILVLGDLNHLSSVALAVFAIIVATVWIGKRVLNSRRLPDVDNQTFLARFAEPSRFAAGTVLRQRQRLAHLLGVPPGKLSPEQQLRELGSHFGFSWDFHVGLGHLQEELFERAKSTGQEVPTIDSAVTVAEAIRAMIDVEEVIKKS